ncbi:MAG: hypothetical protein K9M45_03635 [Kiritimatiellales bacterium]|nr:hypothetical protein [Kiritimatiellales bacterium]
MKYTRVNLIRKAELRYQGAVGGRFLLVCFVVTPIILIAMLSGIKLMQYSEVQSSLKSNQQLWSELKPKLAQFHKEKRGYEANRKALVLIDAWKGSQISWDEMFGKIQERIPVTIQATRLSIRSEGGAGRYAEAEELALDYRFELQGVSKGENAEGAVIALRKNLLESEQLSSVFDSMKLASMRKQLSSDEAIIQQFKLEGTGKSGGIIDETQRTE